MNEFRLITCLSETFELDLLRIIKGSKRFILTRRSADVTEALAAGQAGFGNLILCEPDPVLERQFFAELDNLEVRVVIVRTSAEHLSNAVDYLELGAFLDLHISEPQRVLEAIAMAADSSTEQLSVTQIEAPPSVSAADEVSPPKARPINLAASAADLSPLISDAEKDTYHAEPNQVDETLSPASNETDPDAPMPAIPESEDSRFPSRRQRRQSAEADSVDSEAAGNNRASVEIHTDARVETGSVLSGSDDNQGAVPLTGRSRPADSAESQEGVAANVSATAPQPLPREVILVRGTAGAPGRSTLALNLCSEIARLHGSCLLIDADLFAPCAAVATGVLTGWAGISLACTLASRERLDPIALSDLTCDLGGGAHLLTGLSADGNWRDLTESDFKTVLKVAKQVFGFVVVDTCAWRQPQETSFYAEHSRGDLARWVIEQGARCLTVGSADPVGVVRLSQLLKTAPIENEVVVVNRVSKAAAGNINLQKLQELFGDLVSRNTIFALPESTLAKRALFVGSALRIVDPKDALSKEITKLASYLTRGEMSPPQPQRRSWKGLFQKLRTATGQLRSGGD